MKTVGDTDNVVRVSPEKIAEYKKNLNVDSLLSGAHDVCGIKRFVKPENIPYLKKEIEQARRIPDAELRCRVVRMLTAILEYSEKR